MFNNFVINQKRLNEFIKRVLFGKVLLVLLANEVGKNN